MELVYEGEQEGAVAVAKHHRQGREGDLHEVLPRRLQGQGEGQGAASDYDPIFRWFAQGKKVEISDELHAASSTSGSRR